MLQKIVSDILHTIPVLHFFDTTEWDENDKLMKVILFVFVVYTAFWKPGYDHPEEAQPFHLILISFIQIQTFGNLKWTFHIKENIHIML